MRIKFKISLLSKIILLIISLFVEVGRGIAKAAGLTLQNPLGSDIENFGDLLGKIASQLVIISIPIVSIMVLVGGFQMLTAGGNPEKFKKGKDTVVYAAIGFAVVLLAKSFSLIIESIFK